MGSAKYFLPTLDRNQVVVSDNLWFARRPEDEQVCNLASVDRDRVENADWPCGSSAGRRQSSESENLSHERRQSDEFKRIVIVWAVGVKPSWDDVMATLLDHRRGNTLREGCGRPGSTMHKAMPLDVPD